MCINHHVPHSIIIYFNLTTIKKLKYLIPTTLRRNINDLTQQAIGYALDIIYFYVVAAKILNPLKIS